VKIVLAILLILLLLTPALNAQITKIWAVDGSQYVNKDSRDCPARNNDSNKVWRGDSIHIFAAGNETASFQFVLEAGSLAADSINVKLDLLTDGTNTIQNTSDDAAQYVGRNIELFLEHHRYVGNRGSSIYWANAYPLPDDLYLGWVADALVPLEAPRKKIPNGLDTAQGGAGGKTGPGFCVFANKNTVVWFDIFVPKNMPSGVYRGNVIVWKTNTGGILYSVPIALSIYNFSLSDTTHIPIFAHYNGPALASRTGITQGSAAYWDWVRKMYFLAHRHRFDLITGQEYLDTLRIRKMGYYSGWMFAPAFGYEGPGERVGQNVYIAALYNTNYVDWPTVGLRPWQAGPSYTNTQDGWRRLTDDYERIFRDLASHVIRGVELIDEAEGSVQQQAMSQVADWVRTNPGVGKFLHLFAPNGWMDDELTKHVPAPGFSTTLSMWSQHPVAGPKYSHGYHTNRYWGEANGMTVEALRKRMSGDSLKGLVGTYNTTPGYMPGIEGPDLPLVQARLLLWALWEYNVDFFWIWSATFWSEVGKNPWTEMIPGYGLNDVGSFMYYGKDVLFPNEDRGIAMPIVSIRLKAMRDGIRDYEYLWLAKQRNLLDTNWINNASMLAAFDDFRYPQHQVNRVPQWTTRGWVVEAQRQLMANALGTVGGEPPATTTNKRLRAYR